MIYQFNLSFSLSLVFMGFLLANIFGIITNSKNIIFLFVLCIELINCFIYSQKIRSFFSYEPFEKSTSNKFTPFYLLNVLFRPIVLLALRIMYTKQVRNTEGKYFPTYKLQKRSLLDSLLKSKNYKNMKNGIRYKSSIIASSLNFLKIGFEFGFFIDAFKLGS